MELRQLITFSMISRTLSFSRAAAALNYVQSSITMQMQALEEELGVQLFDRLGKRVALTDAGKRFLVYAEKALDVLDEARCAMKGGEDLIGTVTISASDSLCTYRLPAVLRQFRVRFPQARLVFRPCPYHELKRSVQEGDIDVIFLSDDLVHSRALAVEPLVQETLQVLVAPDHPLARLSSVRTEDLRDELFLLAEKGCNYRTMFEQALSEAGIDDITDLEFTSVEAIKQCTMAGMGIAFLPEVTVAAELAQGKLLVLPWEGHTFQVVTQMLWHQERWLSPALRAFLMVAREVMIPPPVQP